MFHWNMYKKTNSFKLTRKEPREKENSSFGAQWSAD